MSMHKDIQKVLFSEKQIEEIVARLGEEISKDYKDKNLLLVGILKGSVVFMADLMRKLTIPCNIEFMALSSYGSGTCSSGVVRVIKDLSIDIKDYDVLVIEDILDSGNTLSQLKTMLEMRNPKSFKICTFFDKPDRRTANIKADYIGAEIPDEFIVGYGLDFDEKYRNLSYVGVVKPELYK